MAEPVWILVAFDIYYPAGGVEDFRKTWRGGDFGEAKDRAAALVDMSNEIWELIQVGGKNDDFRIMWHWQWKGYGDKAKLEEGRGHAA